MTQQTITPEMLEQYGKALAAMGAGVFPWPRNDEGKQWTSIARITLHAMEPEAAASALKRLYAVPEERTEQEWWPSPAEALAVAADALGLPSVFEGMVPVPLDQIERGLGALGNIVTTRYTSFGLCHLYDDLRNAKEAAVPAKTHADTPWGYNEDDPADCLRAAIHYTKTAAAWCRNACGALADQDSPETAKYRPVLLRYRGELNNLAATLEGKGGDTDA